MEAEHKMKAVLQLRRDTLSRWQEFNPVLGSGEPGYELDTGRLKVGDGNTVWSHLPYFDAGSGVILPVALSQLENDVGFITAEDVPSVPLNISDLINDAGYVTADAVPTRVSQLENDAGYATSLLVETLIPTNISDLTDNVGIAKTTDIPSRVTQLENDAGYVTASSIPTDINQLSDADGLLDSVKSTAPVNRRIEELTGYSEVSVEEEDVIEQVVGTAINNPGTEEWSVYLDQASNVELNDAIVMHGRWGNQTGDYKWKLVINEQVFSSNVEVYLSSIAGVECIVAYTGGEPVTYTAGDQVQLSVVTDVKPQRWFSMPGTNARGAVIDFHAYSLRSGTIIGTIHIARDTGRFTISHLESTSGSSNINNVDLWFRDRNNGNEREIYFRRLDGQSDTLKVQWIAKVFYGSEYYD
jgi:hypothetical protein